MTKSDLHSAMYAYAAEFLASEPIISVKRFEKLLHEKFASEAIEYGDMLDGKNRTEFENLTDWVKARLSKQGHLIKVDIQGKNSYVYLENIGGVLEHGDLARWNDAAKVIRKLITAFCQQDGNIV